MYTFLDFHNNIEVLLTNRSLNTRLYTDNTIQFIKQIKQGWYEFDIPTWEEYKNFYDEDITEEDYKYDFEFDKYYLFIQIINDCVVINTKVIYTPFTTEEYAEDWSECFEYLVKYARPAADIPVKLHYGLIQRKVLYDLIPIYREEYLFNKNFDTQELLDYIQSPDINKIPMTLNTFLNACYLCYEANDVEIENDLLESYNKNADGRHDGLLNIEKDSVQAFEKWRKENHYGHPYEIMRGGNSTHISLYPMLDDETNLYYFILQGKANTRSIETLNAYVNLRKHNIPVKLSDEDILINRLLETDYVGILPYYLYYSYYNKEFEKLFNVRVSDSLTWFAIEENIPLDRVLPYVQLKKEE